MRYRSIPAAAFFVLLTAGSGLAQELILGIQESGTVQWEIETILSRELDEKHGVTLTIRPLADSRAGQIALQAGEVDVILSDFVWVSIQRANGGTVTMVPHSLAVGGVMVPPDSAISDVDDLKGKTVAVAGGPIDKSWVILQAYYQSITGERLADAVSANFGAPPLVNELLAAGRADAALNFWQWNARAKVAGATELLSVKSMLEALGIAEQPPLLGWTFTEETAAEKHDAIIAFLDASFEAKSILGSDDAAWAPLSTLMGAPENDALFVQLRDDYRAGIVSHYDPTHVEPAEETFAVLARFGGTDLVGTADSLALGTFWQGYSK